MLERTTKSYLENVIAEDFNYIQSDIVELEKKKTDKSNKSRNSKTTLQSNDINVEPHIMTRKTRTRRPRISALQSGYCAVCNLPYNSVEEHIQSKKHQKLIGEDANYIALNGSLNGFLQSNSIPFLNLNGIDAIGVHDTSLDDFTPIKKRPMRRTRAASVMIDRINHPSPLSPTLSDAAGHHLRSRRNINYMTPPLEDDSFQEKPDLTPRDDHEQENKDCRELRSSSKSLSKLVSLPLPQDEVWNSGRPKRACISRKRLSVDERLAANYKTYYKVEVVPPKQKSISTKIQETNKRPQSQSPKRDEEKDKGLIVKFKKLRNSELTRLNNEATNFLFPKKDETSEDDECNTTVSSMGSNSNLEMSECQQSTPNIRNEDEGSMDSTEKKRKRRSHAEAFILDNQKYYKFETPGSRLRYQGSYLPMVLRSPEQATKTEDDVEFEEPEEKKIKYDAKVKLDNYKFAFEKVPSKTGWYNAFKRLDNNEQSYAFFSNYLWECLLLPYQMRTIQPLDRRACLKVYHQLLKCLLNPPSESNSRTSSPEPSGSTTSTSMYDPAQDEDSTLSASTNISSCSDENKIVNTKNAAAKVRKGVSSKLKSISPHSSKNPRKSPRQHASTLAILSSLIHQRKKRSKGKEEDNKNLFPIKEEESQVTEEVVPISNTTVSTPVLRGSAPLHMPVRNSVKMSVRSLKKKPVTDPLKTPNETSPRKGKPKIDYYSIARRIDEELETAGGEDLENIELEISDENQVLFNNTRTTVSDILGLYEETNSKETEKSCRKFFNGSPGRKPGLRRKKLNKTGWPNKKTKTFIKKDASKSKDDEVESTIDAASVHENDTDDDPEESNELAVEEDEPLLKKSTRQNITQKQVNNKTPPRVNSKSSKVNVNKSDENKILSELMSSDMQPYVCVQKLDKKKYNKKLVPQRIMNRHKRASKCSRMSRKPAGRWYRER